MLPISKERLREIRQEVRGMLAGIDWGTAFDRGPKEPAETEPLRDEDIPDCYEQYPVDPHIMRSVQEILMAKGIHQDLVDLPEDEPEQPSVDELKRLAKEQMEQGNYAECSEMFAELHRRQSVD